MGWGGRRRRGGPENIGFFVIFLVMMMMFSGLSSSLWLILLALGLGVLLLSSLAVNGNSQANHLRSRTPNRTLEEMRREVADFLSEAVSSRPIQEVEPDPEKTADPQTVANRALRRAGNQPDSWMLDLNDVGILAYHDDPTPTLCRVSPIPSDSEHIRPFVVIDLPYRQGRGTISFALYDETGDKRFEYKQVYELKQGHNFITTRTWLPLPESHPGGRWSLRVNIGDRPLAVHEFQVRPTYGGQIREFMHADGEIDPWLAKSIAEQSTGERLSLDELLAEDWAGEESQSAARLAGGDLR